MKLKKGDTVMVIAGKNFSKQSTIEKVFPKVNKIIVSGVNISKHHLKPSRKNPHGGIMDKPTPIDNSNVMLVCPRCGKPTRIGYKLTGTKTDNKKVYSERSRGAKKMRVCRKCHESVD